MKAKRSELHFAESLTDKAKIIGALVGGLYFGAPNVTAAPLNMGTSTSLAVSAGVVTFALDTNNRRNRRANCSKRTGGGTNYVGKYNHIHDRLDAIFSKMLASGEIENYLDPSVISGIDQTSDSHDFITSYKLADVSNVKKSKQTLSSQDIGKMVSTRASEAGFESPNDWAIEHARKALSFLEQKNIALEFMNPSSEGGIIVEFYNNSNYYLIEFYNDEEVVFLIRDSSKRRSAWDLNSGNFLNFIAAKL